MGKKTFIFVESSRGLVDALTFSMNLENVTLVLVGWATALSAPKDFSGNLVKIHNYSKAGLSHLQFSEADTFFVTDETFNVLSISILESKGVDLTQVNLLSHLGGRKWTEVNESIIYSVIRRLKWMLILLVTGIKTNRIFPWEIHSRLFRTANIIRFENNSVGYTIPVAYAAESRVTLPLNFEREPKFYKKHQKILILLPLLNRTEASIFRKDLEDFFEKYSHPKIVYGERIYIKFHPRATAKERKAWVESLPNVSQLDRTLPLELFDLRDYVVASLRTTAVPSGCLEFISFAEAYNLPQTEGARELVLELRMQVFFEQYVKPILYHR